MTGATGATNVHGTTPPFLSSAPSAINVHGTAPPLLSGAINATMSDAPVQDAVVLSVASLAAGQRLPPFA